MRFYHIALFLFIFNLMGGMVAEIGWYGESGFKPTNQAYTQQERVEDAYEDTNKIDQNKGILGDLNYLVENVRVVIEIGKIFAQVFGRTVLVKPTMTNILCGIAGAGCENGVLNEFINIITAGVLFTYVIGVMQFLSGRNIRAME